jgi:subtilase family serine protease
VVISSQAAPYGYGVEFPASSQYVTAVGGTSLNRDSSARGWSETVWSGSGSGCSAYVSKPSWQTDGGCSRRTVADVSAVADPYTGVAVYDTFRTSGWLVFGGTSVASPIVAGVYALAGNTATTTAGSGRVPVPG